MESAANKGLDVSISQGKVLKELPETYSVLQCPLKCISRISQNLPSLSFFSLTVTPEEISVVAPDPFLQQLLLGEEDIIQIEPNWTCFKIEGPLDFALVGILHAILDPLKQAGISVLAIGTYNTDYFLVKKENKERAKNVLLENGYQFLSS